MANQDVLGLKPVAKSVEIVTQGSVDGISAFLARLCLPAAEELGFLLQDKVRNWRAANANRVAEKAEVAIRAKGLLEVVHAHPRIAGKILEAGSWEENDLISSMWAGLLVSACTEDGKDQSNLIHVNILQQLNANQALIIKTICERCKKTQVSSLIVPCEDLVMVTSEAVESFGYASEWEMDIDLDYIREIGLLQPEGGIDAGNPESCNLTPSSLCINLYVRAQGFRGAPAEYFADYELPL
jgi:Abortive infection alpha